MADKCANEELQPRELENTESSLALRPLISWESRLLNRVDTLSLVVLGGHSRPAKCTIYLLLLGFAVFLILGSLATQFPHQEMRLVFVAVSSTLLFCLAAISAIDLGTRSRLSDLISSLSTDMLRRTPEISSKPRQHYADGASRNDTDDGCVHAPMVLSAQ